MTSIVFRPGGRRAVDDPYPTGDCPACGGIAIPLTRRRKVAAHKAAPDEQGTRRRRREAVRRGRRAAR